MADERPRSPVDDLVDLLVYAPVGLLYEYDEVLPRLVKRGKSQVQLARVIGKMAAERGGPESVGAVVEALANMMAERVTEIGSAIGLAPPIADDEAGAEDPLESGSGRGGATAEPGDDGEPRPLPIAGYDRLTAREIVGLLDELDAGQLARIRAHEEANRARKTVLGKLDRLGA